MRETVAHEALSGSDDETVARRVQSEARILVTLDLDFANIQGDRPGEHAGIIVLRLKMQDKETVVTYMRRVAAALAQRDPSGELWIVGAIAFASTGRGGEN